VIKELSVNFQNNIFMHYSGSKVCEGVFVANNSWSFNVFIAGVHEPSYGHIPADVHRLSLPAHIPGELQQRDLVPHGCHGAARPATGRQAAREAQHCATKTLQDQVSLIDRSATVSHDHL